MFTNLIPGVEWRRAGGSDPVPVKELRFIRPLLAPARRPPVVAVNECSPQTCGSRPSRIKLPQVLSVTARLHGENCDGIGLLLFSWEPPQRAGTLLPLTATTFSIDEIGETKLGWVRGYNPSLTKRTVDAVLEVFRTKIPFDC